MTDMNSDGIASMATALAGIVKMVWLNSELSNEEKTLAFISMVALFVPAEGLPEFIKELRRCMKAKAEAGKAGHA